MRQKPYKQFTTRFCLPGLHILSSQRLLMVGFSLRSGLAGVQRLALMRVELGFDNPPSLVDIERLELRITGFTDADYGNVLRYDPEITSWHG